jgi:serine/threonine protein kinase/Flp pilus assembly protein TadD
MTLATGTRIGNYEIVAPLGAGGMGEVYRAHDRRLERTVAIKALPQSLAAHPDRVARFEREAKMLAALNHANIAGIHGVEDVGGSSYLVLEFVEGETLVERLARGPLTTREVLDLGAQIASALEAAHDRGIVHRDLKPGNIMITPTLGVKVLDFGLARGHEDGSVSSIDLSASPTVAMLATGQGVILGTAPYMSPEQSRGRPVDRRTDVWAFGCVLFECLTARQAFAGETASDVIARILERDPDWSALPAHVPARLRDLIRRCLTKDAAERPRDIGDLRRELGAIASELTHSGVSSGVASASNTPSLAVLYFENLAQDPESEYFCAGITEDILTDLSKIRGMRVASRNAVARFRGAPADIPRVASELGVGAVLEGSVRRSGQRVRITAQLINAADGFHLWAERYDRTLEDVFAVQEEIASSIASALKVALTPKESANLVQDRPKDVRAYDLYLKGREMYGRYTRESIGEALALFRHATELDPGYARAFAGIADCHGQMLQWGHTEHAEDTIRLGLEAARRAIALNPRLAEAHKAEALVLRFAGDKVASRAALKRAIEADSRFVPALTNLAVAQFCDANLAGAERLVRRSLDADPEDAFATTWLALLTLCTDRFEECLSLVERIRRLSSEPFYTAIVLNMTVHCQLRSGDFAAGERTLIESRSGSADRANVGAVEAIGAARAGRMDEARRLLDEIEPSTRLNGSALALSACAALRVGEPERALRFMSRGIIADLAPVLTRLDPELHPLLEREPFAPRRMNSTLVWTLEAPMIDAGRHALFKEVRIESGVPHGSDVLSGLS